MTLPRHEEAPGGDRRRGPKDVTEPVSILSIVAPAKEGTLKMRVFCQFVREY